MPWKNGYIDTVHPRDEWGIRLAPTGKTVRIMKDKEKGNDVTNFRPLTCLPLMWNIFTEILGDELHDHLESEKLLLEEQKGFQRG